MNRSALRLTFGRDIVTPLSHTAGTYIAFLAGTVTAEVP
jgi:hypothetical protein